MPLNELVAAAKNAFDAGKIKPMRKSFYQLRPEGLCGCAVTAAYIGSGKSVDVSYENGNYTTVTEMNERLRETFGVTQDDIRGLIQGFDGEDMFGVLPQYTEGHKAGAELASTLTFVSKWD